MVITTEDILVGAAKYAEDAASHYSAFCDVSEELLPRFKMVLAIACLSGMASAGHNLAKNDGSEEITPQTLVKLCDEAAARFGLKSGMLS